MRPPYGLLVENVSPHFANEHETLTPATCWVQLTGVLLVAGTVLLKWSFVAPYVTDRIAKWTLAHLFPFAGRDVLTISFFKSKPCNHHPKPRLIRAHHPDSGDLDSKP